MSIATMSGDKGTTALAGGARLSKADLRVESYGTVDELGAVMGFARSLCTDAQVAGWTEAIQRKLFMVGAALSTPPEALRLKTYVTVEDVDYLTGLVTTIEAEPNILADWSLPGAHRESAAFEMARTVCRRAERLAVRLAETSTDDLIEVPPEVIAFLNRLSDVIWLFGRLIELRAGVDSTLRDDSKAGANFSRAW